MTGRRERQPPEHPRENRIDVLEVIAEVEQRLEFGGAQRLGDVLVGLQQRQELALAAPHRHGVALHQRIGVLARNALLRQRQQHALRMDEAAEPVEVLAHGVGIDEQLVDHVGQSRQREIERDRRVGADHPLDRGMRDVALVPQRDVLQRRDDRRAHDAGEAGQVLAQAPGCACAASPTSPSALRRNIPPPPAPRCAADGGSRWRAARPTRRRRASAAKNAAWRSRGITWVETGSGFSPSLRRDMRFDPRVDVGEGADRAGDRAGGDLLARRDQPRRARARTRRRRARA